MSETRINLEFGGPLGSDPRGGLGNSETRNLEFGGPLGSDPRGGLGNSETRNLEFAREYVPGICTYSESWNLEFAEEYPGIFPRRNKEFGNWGPSADPQRGLSNLGNSETRNLEFAEEYPGICTLETWNLDFGVPTEGPRKLGKSESGFRRGVSPGESAHLETWNLEFGFPCLHGKYKIFRYRYKKYNDFLVSEQIQSKYKVKFKRRRKRARGGALSVGNRFDILRKHARKRAQVH